MNNLLTGTLVASMLGIASVMAGPLDCANAFFTAWDGNGDGWITATEAFEHRQVFDQNHDGTTTLAEYAGVWETLACIDSPHAWAVAKLSDTNNNGDVTFAELKLPHNDFAQYGGITLERALRTVKELLRETPLAILFNDADTDSNMLLDDAESANLFSSFDENGDGAVTRAEFKDGWEEIDLGISDPTFLYDYFDVNSDGNIVPYEVLQRHHENHSGPFDLHQHIVLRSFLTDKNEE